MGEVLLMRFEWDEGKNRRNLAKHKVSFETASLVFEDPRALSIQDRLLKERSDGRRLEWFLARYCSSLIPIGSRLATR